MGSLPAGIPVEIEMILEVAGGGAPARKPARAKPAKKSRKRR
jgi:hypothetical protein